MIDDAFVIDGVVHAWDMRPEILRGPHTDEVVEQTYAGHLHMSPRGEPKWVTSRDKFKVWGPETIAHALFAESYTDVGIYHEVGMYHMFSTGVSPEWVGKRMQELYPGRILRYGYVSPWQENALEEVDRHWDEGCVGIKLYPYELVNDELRDFRLDDEKIAFPVFARAQERGFRSVAFHKAVPFGPYPLEPYKVNDVATAAQAFPDLTFEIVHGGMAFLEETAMLVLAFPNVAINLEAIAALLPNTPHKFARIVGSFLASGGSKRIIWSGGLPIAHTRPMLEAFWRMEMPRDLVEEEGFPELDMETKKDILGRNSARILGLDINKMKAAIADDEFSRMTELAEPWSGYVPAQVPAAV
jgi:uncharacterized protein